MKFPCPTRASFGTDLPARSFLKNINWLRTVWLLVWLLVLASVPQAGAADEHPFLHPLFCDHAVLQRGVAVPVWGWSAPGSKITVAFAGQSRTAIADANGKWLVKLKSMRASSEPRSLSVTNATTHDSVVINDVLVGDVWLRSEEHTSETPVT